MNEHELGKQIQIPLNKGLFAIVDESDFGLVKDHTWHILTGPTGVLYAATHIGRKTHPLMHRLILGFPEFLIDHVNGNGLDNRKHNLRPATRLQNRHNSKMDRRNTSGFTGVTRWKGKWKSTLTRNGSVRYLGLYATAVEAAAAYDAALLSCDDGFSVFNLSTPTNNQIANLRQAAGMPVTP